MIRVTKKSIYLLCLVGILAAGCTSGNGTTTVPRTPTLTPTQKIAVDGTIVSVHIAASPTEQQRGLSGIPSVQKNEGMLFPYTQPSRPTFWMKDMLFPIDIIWIRDGRVVGIDHNLQPPNAGYADDTLARYIAPGDVTAVLEMQAGWAATHAIHPGSVVTELPH